MDFQSSEIAWLFRRHHDLFDFSKKLTFKHRTSTDRFCLTSMRRHEWLWRRRREDQCSHFIYIHHAHMSCRKREHYLSKQPLSRLLSKCFLSAASAPGIWNDQHNQRASWMQAISATKKNFLPQHQWQLQILANFVSTLQTVLSMKAAPVKDCRNY